MESLPKECGGLWNDPEPQIDLFAADFDINAYREPEGEFIEGLDDEEVKSI